MMLPIFQYLGSRKLKLESILPACFMLIGMYWKGGAVQEGYNFITATI